MKLKLEVRAFLVNDRDMPEGTILPSTEWKAWVKEHGQWVKLERFVEASMLPKDDDVVLYLRDSMLMSNGVDGWALVGDELVPVLWLTTSDTKGEPSVIWDDEYADLLAQGWKVRPEGAR